MHPPYHLVALNGTRLATLENTTLSASEIEICKFRLILIEVKAEDRAIQAASKVAHAYR